MILHCPNNNSMTLKNANIVKLFMRLIVKRT